MAVHWSCKPGVPSSILGVAFFFGRVRQKFLFMGNAPQNLLQLERFLGDTLQVSYTPHSLVNEIIEAPRTTVIKERVIAEKSFFFCSAVAYLDRAFGG